MARPGLGQHRKFRRLVKAVGSAPLARGCLELMWDTCYEAGDDYLGTPEDVEIAAQWPGEDGVLFDALLGAGGDGNAGFVEPCPERPGHYRCHDLYDHAPDYVQKRMAREAQRKQRGITLREMRAAAGRRSGEARRAASAAAGSTSGEQMADGCLPGVPLCSTPGEHKEANACTPAPAPAPTPAPAPAHLEDSPLPGVLEAAEADASSSKRRAAERVVEWWNAHAAAKGCIKANGLTAKREKAIGIRMRESGWLESVEDACRHLGSSKHHTGGNDRGWRADLDFLLQEGQVQRFAEAWQSRGGGSLRSRDSEWLDHIGGSL